MHKFIAVCALFAAIGVVCSVDPEPIAIVRSETKVNEDGSYNFMYEGADGNFREETGSITNPGAENEAISVSGSYKYIDSNGQEVSVQYTADENGFVPVGTNILQQISDLALAARNVQDTDETDLSRGKPKPRSLPAVQPGTTLKPVTKVVPVTRAAPATTVAPVKVAEAAETVEEPQAVEAAETPAASETVEVAEAVEVAEPAETV